jgi:fucose 4-O-acetylase-like acetyltransferase
MTDDSRLISADILKGLLIVAIVFIHLVLSRSDVLFSGADAALLDGGGVSSADIGTLVIQAFYLGLMAFFMLSGYFFRPGRGFLENMRRRSMQLVLALAVCAVVLPLIIYAWMALFGKAEGLDDLINAFQWGFGLNGVFEPLDVFTEHPACGGCVGYYYLWGMVWGFLIFYALADRIYDDWRKSVAAIVLLFVITLLLKEFLPIKLPFYCQLGPVSAAFMIIGMMLAKRKVIERIEAFDIRSGSSWGLFLGSLLAVIVLVMLFPPGLEFDYMSFGDYGGYPVFIYAIEALAMFIVYVHLSLLISKMIGLSTLFNVAGQNSLAILLLHGSVATFIAVPFYDFTHGSWFPDTMGLMPSLLIAVVTIAVCVLVSVMQKRYRGRARDSRAAS